MGGTVLSREKALAMSGGGAAEYFAEAAYKITEVFKAGAESNLHDRKIGFPQKTGSVLCPEKIDMLDRCTAEILTEKGAEILRGETEFCGDLRLGETLMKMLL